MTDEELKQLLIAAEQGDAEAQHKLGKYYYNEVKDYNKAFYWTKKSAEQGNAIAQGNIGLIYQLGRGIEKNAVLAHEWFLKAAEQGNSSSQFCLGLHYETGEGVEKDMEKAAYWYKKGAEQGEERAQYNLAFLYYYGEGVEKDIEKSVFWYKKAAEQDFVNAKYNLGVLYSIEKDFERAVYWFNKASKQGDIKATFKLGKYYFEGLGVERDYKTSKLLLEKAIEPFKLESDYLGEAFYMVATIVRDYSPGIKKDLFKAKEYAESSLKLGYDCEDFLDTINEELGISDSPNNKMGQFAKEIIEKKTPISEVFPEVEKVLKERFHDTWQYLQESSKKCLISALIAYISFTSVNKEQYDGMDFSNVVSSIMKACEIEIGRIFYKGYREYLENNNIPASEFNPEKQRFVIEAKNIPNYEPLQSGEISGDNVNFEEYDYYRRKKYDQKGSINYIPKERDNTFTLGAVPFITESAKQQLNFPTSSDQQKPFAEKKYRKEYLINKHFLNYIRDVFKEGTFKNDDEIKEFVFRFTMKIRDITFQLRNPSSHTAVMEYWKAVYCGNAIFMKDNFLQNLLSKIKPEILNKEYN